MLLYPPRIVQFTTTLSRSRAKNPGHQISPHIERASPQFVHKELIAYVYPPPAPEFAWQNHSAYFINLVTGISSLSHKWD
jgi:hypothetical protein